MSYNELSRQIISEFEVARKKFPMFLPVCHALLVNEEVEQAALWCATHGYAGNTGDPLPNLASKRACIYIANNSFAFRCKVQKYAAQLR